jgi:succinate-semialdehyde dehydrogenase/glutarate-semialdehyde dehydrogenase
MVNGGQSCVAAKRFIVDRKISKEFTRKLIALMQKSVMGDPMDPKTTLGPLARMDLRDSLHEQVEKSVAQGAEILLGGEIPEGPGAFYPPTVLGNVRKGMPAYGEELFGPVASVIEVENTDEAVEVANDTPFGLGAAVFTRDIYLGEDIAARRVEAGACFVNDFVKSDPRLPFGGTKQSGYGRELGIYGIKEFVNIKTISIR